MKYVSHETDHFFALSAQQPLSYLQNSAPWMESLDIFLHLNFDHSECNFYDASLSMFWIRLHWFVSAWY